MPNPTYTISTHQSGAGVDDVLVYREADGRSIEFNCRAGAKPVPVWIPLGRWWSERAPSWAQAQRDTIVERVRDWGGLVYEALLDASNNTLTTIQSPDGTFRVECLEEFDDRAPAWERTRIISTAGNEVLVDLPLHGVTGGIGFPRPGEVILDLLGRYGDRRRLRVDVAKRQFHLEDDPELVGHPLHLLSSRLAPPAPSAQARAPKAGRRQSAFELMIGLLGAPFALGGLWLSLSGKSASDRWAGIAGIALGGFAIANTVAELRRRRADRPATSAPKAGLLTSRLAAYVPLLAIGVELAWLAVLLVGFLFVVGDAPYTHTPGAPSVRLWDLIAALPALAGLLFGVACIMRGRAQSPLEWICLILGSAGCGLFVLIFGREFVG
jgi:hypothetical protein